MTEPPEPGLPRWLPLAAATAVGVAGLAAAAVVVTCRRRADEKSALSPSPPADTDPPRALESFVRVVSAERRAPSAQPPRRVTAPLPPVDPKSRRNNVILLLIAAVVVWAWVVGYMLCATAGDTYGSPPASPTDFDPAYLGDLGSVRSDRY
ncbi:hypothetical protein [Actinoplanes sp. CA-252034]|uniref:hypothetical protein n=1 Tax=Actinoplanes sp. CA-252034 TaxID=3239906 RepID=UPI003D988A39